MKVTYTIAVVSMDDHGNHYGSGSEAITFDFPVPIEETKELLVEAFLNAAATATTMTAKSAEAEAEKV